MAVYQTEADMPMLELPGGSIFELRAIDPDSGATVTGVDVSNFAIYGRRLGGVDLSTRIIPTLSAEEVGA